VFVHMRRGSTALIAKTFTLTTSWWHYSSNIG
jgi:hypothetical protein